jgi:hypothetical protein
VTYFGPLGTHSSDLVAYLEAVPGELLAGSCFKGQFPGFSFRSRPAPPADQSTCTCCVAGTTRIKAGYNPATWMLEVTGGSMATTVAANNVDCGCRLHACRFPCRRALRSAEHSPLATPVPRPAGGGGLHAHHS